MITIVVVTSTLIVFTYISLFSRFGMLKLVIGHNAFVDVVFMMLVSGAAVVTGSLTGMLVSVVTGFFLTCSLISMRKYMPYSRIQRRKKPDDKGYYLFKWNIVTYEAENVFSLKDELTGFKNKCLNVVRKNNIKSVKTVDVVNCN